MVIKYTEPPEARKPKTRWRLYPFKGEQAMCKLNDVNLTSISKQMYNVLKIINNSEVNYRPHDVYHIRCMCLDTQWKTVDHSPVKVVYTTKICAMTSCTKSMNIIITQTKIVLQSSSLFTASFLSPFVFKVTPIRIASSFISASKICQNVTNPTKWKKKSSIKTNNTHKCI